MHRDPSQLTNVLGEPLIPCCLDPMTGFFRNGYCQVSPEDVGMHSVCAEMTAPFLAFSKSRGNDLITPRKEYGFPGLKPGDRWCLCVQRWKEAHLAGVAPPVILAACHISALEFVTLEELRANALES